MIQPDIESILLKDIETFDREVKEVYNTLVLPTWNTELHGLHNALYGYMMGVFARIDLASAYCSGSYGNQTRRMVDFMDHYFKSEHEANSVAVQIWRHKLMHTARPRKLHHPETGLSYYWLLQWWEKHLPEDQHFTFTPNSNPKILNLGLVYLIRDLRIGLEHFVRDVLKSEEAQTRFRTVEVKLNSYKLRTVSAVTGVAAR